MKKSLPLIAACILAGCSSTSTNVSRVAPARERRFVGVEVPTEGRESVRYDETLKAYPMGRYVDPNDPRVMHEGHVIYRAEDPPKWNLYPNQPVAVPLGPAVAVNDPSKTPSPLSQELAAELNRQKAATQTTIQQNERLLQYLAALQQQLEKTKQIAIDNADLKKQLNEASQRIDTLENRLAQKNPNQQPADKTAADDFKLQ